MKRSKSAWKATPDAIRKPIVLTIGLSLVIISGTIGWLPGPGGIPLFLIGVTILATEYSWAKRFQNFVLRYVARLSKWYRANLALGNVLLALGISAGIIISLTFYSTIK